MTSPTDENVDGIYTNNQTLEVVESQNENLPDENIFSWYEQNITSCLAGANIIDWGAGIGRFYRIFKASNYQSIIFSEPSATAYDSLIEKFDTKPNIKLLNEPLGYSNFRDDNLKYTHVCNFVINCFSSFQEGLAKLENSMDKDETLFLASNVFVNDSILNKLNYNSPLEYLNLNIANSYNTMNAILPKTFAIQIDGTENIFTDYLHNFDDVYKQISSARFNFKVETCSLVPPMGFKQINIKNEDYKGHKFLVMLLKLSKK